MARTFFETELGISLTGLNGDDGLVILRGSGLPGGDAGDQDNASPGSIYLRDSGSFHVKKTAGSGSDKWFQAADAASIVDPNWRPELVRAATGAVLSAGSVDPTSWADNESAMAAGDFAVGEYVLGGVGGSPALFEVTGVAAPNITIAAASQPLADNDMIMVRKYLVDTPSGQENQALVVYNGSDIVKIADFDWNFANGINLEATYAAGAGNVDNSDTVQSALQKLDGNLDNSSSILGRNVQTDSDMGAYTGSFLSDNQSAKQNLQQVETEAENSRSSLGTNIGDTDMGLYTGVVLTDNTNAKANIQELGNEAEADRQALGTNVGDTNMGTYTGALLNDNESAKQNIQQLESESESLRTLSGTAAGENDLGTFAGNIISDNTDVKSALGELESEIEGISGGVSVSLSGVTAQVELDSVLVDEILSAEWELHAREDASPSNVKVQKVMALHNGHGGADASSVDSVSFAKLKLGSNFNSEVSFDLQGTGASQRLRILVSSSTAGVTFTARRTDVKA